MSKFAIFFWSTVLVGTLVGIGVFVWVLCRPGFSVLETLAFEVGAYGLIIAFIVLGDKGFGAIPVRIINKDEQ